LASDTPTHRFTDAMNDNIDAKKIEAKLNLFDKVVAELDDSLAVGANEQTDTHNHAPWSNGYRNAWGGARMKLALGNKMQQAWETLRMHHPLDALSREFEGERRVLKTLADTVGDLNFYFGDSCRVESMALDLALLCSRFSHWNGVLQACEAWLDVMTVVPPHVVEDSATSTISHVLVVYEFIRSTALSLIGGDFWKTSDATLECGKLMLVTAFYLLGRLAVVFNEDEALSRRMLPTDCFDVGVDVRSNRLISGIVVDLLVVGRGLDKNEDSKALVYDIFECLLEAFGVSRCFVLLELISSLSEVLLEDSHLIQLIDIYLRRAQCWTDQISDDETAPYLPENEFAEPVGL